MGDALRDLGRLEEAGLAYGAAAKTYRDLNDTAPLMALFEDVAVLAARTSRHVDAYTLLGAADALRAALGSVRFSGAEEQLAEALAGSRAAIGGEAADAARKAGAGAVAGRGDHGHAVADGRAATLIRTPRGRPGADARIATADRPARCVLSPP